MINKIRVSDFKAVPYLEGSTLYQSHLDGIEFSTKKPNVLLGPNGSGKSALLKALALQSLSFYTGESSFDDHYVSGREADTYWTETEGWCRKQVYLAGLQCDTDNAPALFYRPGHVPGNERSITCAMMTGYFEQAKAYGKLVENKSSGQQSQALLQRIQDILAGGACPNQYGYVNWAFGKSPVVEDPRYYSGNMRPKAEKLKERYAAISKKARPLILMDEPEQSLDAKAEALLWAQLAKLGRSKVQVIVATHSWYPVLHPDAFNIIEAIPGYLQEVKRLI